MKGLTTRQQQILAFIADSIQGRGYPPTIREIGRHMGIKSTNGVNDHLKALERKGHLRRDDLKSRAMCPMDPTAAEGGETAGPLDTVAANDPAIPGLIAPDDDTVQVRILGRVAAGAPILAEDDPDADTVRVDRFFVGPHDNVFALQVVGDSMIEAGIHHGDYLFVKKTPTADKDTIVVALINGEATCKYYTPMGDEIHFRPANAAMGPIVVKRHEFKQSMIIGVVVGVYRKLDTLRPFRRAFH